MRCQKSHTKKPKKECIATPIFQCFSFSGVLKSSCRVSILQKLLSRFCNVDKENEGGAQGMLLCNIKIFLVNFGREIRNISLGVQGT